MVENKTIGVSTLITLSLLAASMIIPGFFDEPKYFCDSRPELGAVPCDSFSKYVDPNGKCVRNDEPNLICRTGFKLVIDDTTLPEKEIPLNASLILGDDGIYREQVIVG